MGEARDLERFGQDCVICLGLLQEEVCLETICFHVMHERCLLSWLQKYKNCPICRQSIDQEKLIDMQTSEITPKDQQKKNNTRENTNTNANICLFSVRQEQELQNIIATTIQQQHNS